MQDKTVPPLSILITGGLARLRPVDAFLPVVISLHSYKETRDTSLGLLVIWIAWRLVLPLIQGWRASDRKGPVLPHLALFLGLLLVNARPIALRDDVDGHTQFLLIALGFVIGGLLVPNTWRSTFGWLSLSTIPLASLFLQEALASGFPLSLDSIEAIYSSTMRGHGGISRFATLVMMLTVASWYFLLLSRGLLARGLGIVGTICGYLLCMGSGSRISFVAPPLSAFFAWAVLRLKGRSRKMKLRVFLMSAILPMSAILWWFLLSPEAASNRISDYNRMGAARCWLSIMFSGRKNSFLYGVGYGAEKPNEICYHIPDFRGELGSIGHAHNTFAQMGGQHGILGILALLILVLLVALGLRKQLASVQFVLPLGPRGTTWAEAALGINLALAFNALATTIHIANHVNQVLIGLLAATALAAPLPTARSPVRDGAAP